MKKIVYVDDGQVKVVRGSEFEDDGVFVHIKCEDGEISINKDWIRVIKDEVKRE